jgi:hypothetical protein
VTARGFAATPPIGGLLGASAPARLLVVFVALAVPTLLIPWFIPVSPSRSTSYAQGFSNPALWVLVVALLVVPAIALVQSRFAPMFAVRAATDVAWFTDDHLKRASSIGWRTYAVMAVFLLILSPHLSGYFDAEYFLLRASLMQGGKLPYMDFEYAYGPVLLYSLVGLERLGLPAGVSLAILVLLESAVGYAALHRLVHWLMPPRAAQYTFACMLLATAPSLLIGGENYTFFRFAFVAAIACAVIRRVSGRQALLAGWLCGPLFVLAWSISPDVAIAVAASFSLMCAVLSHRVIATCAVAAISLILCMAVTPSLLASYLTLIEFGGGGRNIPAYPGLHVLFFAGCVFLSSLYVAGKSLREHPAEWFLFVYSLVLMPGAFGRADPLHIVFYGFGFVILAARWLLQNELLHAGFRKFCRAYVWIYLLSWVALHGFFTVWSMGPSLTLTTLTVARELRGQPSEGLRKLEGTLRSLRTPDVSDLNPRPGELFIIPPTSGMPDIAGFTTYYVGLENAASDRAFQKLADQIRGKRILIQPAALTRFCEPEPLEFDSVRLLFPTTLFPSRHHDKWVGREFCSLLEAATLFGKRGNYLDLAIPRARSTRP